ncbi:MAG: NADH-quinone oxidoreductase subunit I [Syntrophomonadaceae bacterium]|nr:NADH-quinone oxidoreductase subunit I [Syntrophomonadaceae bacterium]
MDMYGKGLLKGLGITLKHFFQREITEQYPEEMPHLYERYRGSLNFDFSKCIACGICASTCPNNVISLETVKDEATKKRKLITYTIDLQYCMFCNMCVENCPKNCLSFDHNFELSQFKREDIKRVYTRPEGMDDALTPEQGSSAADDKKAKQINAIYTTLLKNPQKLLAKILDSEEQISIMMSIIANDEKKARKIAELIVEDKDKARKVAAAFVNKALKERAAGKQEGGDN